MSKEGEGILEVSFSREERIRQLAENREEFCRRTGRPQSDLDNWAWATDLYNREQEEKKKTKMQRGGY